MPLARAGSAGSSARQETGRRRIGGRADPATLPNPPPRTSRNRLVSAGLGVLHARAMPQRFDFLVLGGGVAGLSFALEAAKHGSVAVLTKRSRAESNTNYAQGGIAAVLVRARHVRAAHRGHRSIAGAGSDHREAVEVTRARRARSASASSSALGARVRPRSPTASSTSPARAATPRRRIVHAGDITGREVERALLAACDDRPNIHVLPRLARRSTSSSIARSPRGQRAACLGAYVLRPHGRDRDASSPR